VTNSTTKIRGRKYEKKAKKERTGKVKAAAGKLDEGKMLNKPGMNIEPTGK
jgi:hypothetical protein